jgi:Bacterial protein of unknown function (DUF937)
MDILELLKSQLSGPVVEKLGGLLGLDAAQAQKIGEVILPAQVAALTQKASTEAGAQHLLDLSSQVPQGSPLDLIGSSDGLDQVRQSGTALLPQLMGNGLEDSVQNLATQTGTSRGSIQGMMQMLLPMVLGVVGGQASKLGLNASSLSGLFSGGLGSVGGLGGAAAGLGGAAAGLGGAVAGLGGAAAGLGAAAAAGLGGGLGKLGEGAAGLGAGLTKGVDDAAAGLGGAAAGLGGAAAGLGAGVAGLGAAASEGLGNAAGKLGDMGANLNKGAAGVVGGVTGAAAGLGVGAVGLGAAAGAAATKGMATVSGGAGLNGGNVHTNPALGGRSGMGWLWLLPLLLLLGLGGCFLLNRQSAATTGAVPTTTDTATTDTGVTPPPPDALPAAAGVFALSVPAAGASLPAGAFDMTGTGKAGDVLEIFEDGVSLGKVTVGADGNWTLNVPSPAAGAHTYSVKGPDGSELGTVSTTVAAAAASTAACDKAFSLSIKDGEAVAQPFRFGGVGKGKSYTVTVMRGEKKIGTKELPLDGTCGYSYTSKPGKGTITYMVSESGMADVAGKITLDVK